MTQKKAVVPLKKVVPGSKTTTNTLNELFSVTSGDWIRCQQCQRWAQELCSNLTGVGFICDLSEGKCQCYEMFNQLYSNECAKNIKLMETV